MIETKTHIEQHPLPEADAASKKPTGLFWHKAAFIMAKTESIIASTAIKPRKEGRSAAM